MYKIEIVPFSLEQLMKGLKLDNKWKFLVR